MVRVKITIDNNICKMIARFPCFDPRSTDFFRECMDGTLGRCSISKYIAKLQACPEACLLSSALRRDFFVMVLVQIGETWRRFCHKRDAFPYIWWKLCDVEGDALIDLAREMQTQAAKCPSCVDPAFSGALLGFLPNPLQSGNNEHLKRVKQLQSFLRSASVFCPISTDATEALHGFSQAKLHRFRGNKPTDEVAKEITIWSKITSSYQTLRQWIWDRTGDSHGLRRLKRGRTSGKIQSWERLRIAAMQCKRKPKKLCGSLCFH